MNIEVIVQNKEEAVEAEKCGVDRLELVSSIEKGGLTPSYQVMHDVLNSVSIPVHVMIRPHSKNFHYDDRAMEKVMIETEHVIALGGRRVVFGALTDDYMIDEAAINRIVNEYPSIDITFHRAFDEVNDQVDAYKKLSKYPQIKRILTSGGASNCIRGRDQLKVLRRINMDSGGPDIMPGAGLSPENIASIHAYVQANQYHFGKAVRIKQSYTHSFSKKALGMIFHHTKQLNTSMPEYLP